MKKFIYLLFFLSSSFLDAVEISKEEIDNLSYYQGYQIYIQYLKNHSFPYNFSKILEGFEEAHKGKNVKFNEEEIAKLLEKTGNYLAEKLLTDNLKKANEYLSKISGAEGISELIKGKLYCKIIKAGNGKKIDIQGMPLMKYKVAILEGEEESLLFEEDEPKAIALKSAIEGFFIGVSGMEEGERRILYIHPDLAYGATSSRIPPNSLLIFEVEIIENSAI